MDIRNNPFTPSFETSISQYYSFWFIPSYVEHRFSWNAKYGFAILIKEEFSQYDEFIGGLIPFSDKNT
jgi:hypothetical protein